MSERGAREPAHLEIAGLSADAGGGPALNGVTLDAAEGSILAVLGGPSSGKSALARCIAGVWPIEAGEIWIDGENVAARPPARRPVAACLEGFPLFGHLTAFENLAAPLAARGLRRREIARRIGETADRFDLEPLLGAFPSMLGPSERKGFELVRALALEPELLALDDPLREVEPARRETMRVALEEIVGETGVTTLLLTRDYRDALALGDRLAILDRGRIVETGAPEAIWDAPRDLAAARLFGDPPMNLIEAEPDRDRAGATVTIGGCEIAIGRSCVAERVVLGVKPEEWRFAESGVRARAFAETRCEERTIVWARLDDGQEIAVAHPHGEPRAGEALTIAGPLRWYDARTGRRLGVAA